MRRRPSSVDEAVALGRMILERDRLRAAPVVATLKEKGSLRPGDWKRLSGGPLIDLLLEISYRLRFDDPDEMVLYAKAACGVADGLTSRRYGKEVVADLRARAWAELANAYRAADRFDEAGPALAKSRDLMSKGTKSPGLLARFAELLGKYLVDLRQFAGAHEALESAADLYAELGLREESVRARVGLAHSLTQAYDPERASMVYLQVLQGLDFGSPHQLAATHGLILNLVEAGHSGLAEKLLTRPNRRLYRRGGKLNKLRLLWLEGKIAKGLGQYGRAEGKLVTAHLAFRHEGQVYDSALVALDLAWVYAQQKRRQETIWLVESIITTFQRLGIARESLASLTLLKTSCEQRKPVDSVCGQIEALGRVLPELRPRKRVASR